MNSFVMKLPELNCLKPNEHTTFKKLVEEIAECNEALESLRLYEEKYGFNWLLLSDLEMKIRRKGYKEKLTDVLGEIMDIAQVCASQLFVFEKLGLDINVIFEEYSTKKNLTKNVVFHTKDNCRYVFLPENDNENSVQTVMNKIIFCMGNIAQLDKFTGENGENPSMKISEANREYIFNLLDIIQYCFNLLFSMKDKYSINIKKLFEDHLDKLIRKGYYKKNNLFRYVYNCTNPDNLDELNYLVDNGEEITRKEFVENVLGEDLMRLEKDLGYSNYFAMKDDWGVQYWKAKYKEELVYFFTQSAIEYVFKNKNSEKKNHE